MGLRGFLHILQKMKMSSLPRTEPLFLGGGLLALSLSSILSALSGLPVNYRNGDLGNNVVNASVINISPFF